MNFYFSGMENYADKRTENGKLGAARVTPESFQDSSESFLMN